jgi:hypothetical protein
MLSIRRKASMRFSRVTFGLAVIALVGLATLALSQGNRGTAEVTIKGKKISINYGRPTLRGQDPLSRLPVGGVWRLGMNQPTQIDSGADLTVAGKEIKAGKYSLWVRRTGEQSWLLAFHSTVPAWGVPELKEGYVAELPLKLASTSESAEQLTISLAEDKGQAAVKIHWGTAQLTGSFGVK